MNRIEISNKINKEEYLNLFQKIYKEEKKLPFFISDISHSIEFVNQEKTSITVSIRSGDGIIAHASLMYDAHSTEARLGFFELINEKDFPELWNAILKEVKTRNIDRIVGPINGSIWFPYRFIKDSNGEPFFKGELPTQKFYQDIFTQIKSKEIGYYSSFRNKFENIISVTESSYLNIKQSGYEVFSHDSFTQDLLKEIYDFSCDIFSVQSIFYDTLPYSYFKILYGETKLQSLFKIYVVRRHGKLIAFLTVFKEGDETLIFKTIAVLPDEQGRGVGKALIHLAHLEAYQQGYKKMIYALIRGDNDVKFFPKDDVENLRTYSLFDISL